MNPSNNNTPTTPSTTPTTTTVVNTSASTLGANDGNESSTTTTHTTATTGTITATIPITASRSATGFSSPDLSRLTTLREEETDTIISRRSSTSSISSNSSDDTENLFTPERLILMFDLTLNYAKQQELGKQTEKLFAELDRCHQEMWYLIDMRSNSNPPHIQVSQQHNLEVLETQSNNLKIELRKLIDEHKNLIYDTEVATKAAMLIALYSAIQLKLTETSETSVNQNQ